MLLGAGLFSTWGFLLATTKPNFSSVWLKVGKLWPFFFILAMAAIKSCWMLFCPNTVGFKNNHLISLLVQSYSCFITCSYERRECNSQDVCARVSKISQNINILLLFIPTRRRNSELNLVKCCQGQGLLAHSKIQSCPKSQKLCGNHCCWVVVTLL